MERARIYDMLLTVSYSELASSIILVEPLKPRFHRILEFIYFLVVNNDKYLSYVVDNIIFKISVPDYPSRTVESKSLQLFCNLVYSIYIIFIYVNNNTFTYDKFKSAKFGFSILDMF